MKDSSQTIGHQHSPVLVHIKRSAGIGLGDVTLAQMSGQERSLPANLCIAGAQKGVSRSSVHKHL